MRQLHHHPHMEERARRLGCLDAEHVIVDRDQWLAVIQPIKLSRRNLLTLLHKLEMPGSHRTLVKPDGVAITVEPDEVHYADRPGGPGPVHPETEEFVRDMNEALAIVRRGRAIQQVAEEMPRAPCHGCQGNCHACKDGGP